MPDQLSDALICRRCKRPVLASAGQYDVIEKMHYVCFHYEFEHDPADPDEECRAGGCPSAHTKLRDTLAEWTDWDRAAFFLGRSIGVYDHLAWVHGKGDMWTDSLLGNGLHNALLVLAGAGILERRGEPDEQFQWHVGPARGHA